MQFIDTHCHLFAEEFDADRNEVVNRAISKGIDLLLLPNIDPESIAALKALHKDFPNNCLGMMGLHPCSVTADYEQKLKTIQKELAENTYIAIGEIGLDYYWDTTFKEEQIKTFRTQLQWAKELQLPVAIHTRNSFEDAITIVEEELDENLKGVFHCFGGSEKDAERIMACGFFMGIGGVVTFKNSNLKEVIKKVPLTSLLLETDAPYLAPVPYRGKRNESSYIIEIANKLAEIKEVTVSEIAAKTTENAKKLFRI